MTDVNLEEVAGQFTTADRATVTAGCIPWLASYFADAPSWSLNASPRVGESIDTKVEEIARFIRMRVAIAALKSLEPLIGNVLVRPSFAYTRRVEESVGALRGPLDMQRYIRSRTRPEAPRRYPVRVVHRRFDTDENVVAAYATLHVARDLRAAPIYLLPAHAPERREVERGRSTVNAWLTHPALGESVTRARAVKRSGQLSLLLDRATTRLDSGRVAFPGRYYDLIEWMRAATAEADAAAGDLPWAFYDERFDTKLFEIWSLAQLATALEIELGPVTAAVTTMLERNQRPMRSWEFGGVGVDLYFQPPLGRLNATKPTWTFKEPTEAPLTGFPDLAVVVRPVVGDRRVVLIDPKLRQRKAAPTDELYKLLGYFGNLQGQDTRGAILFYAPGAPKVHRLEGATSAEQLLAVGIDPSNGDEVAAGFKRVADLVLDAASVPPGVLDALKAVAGDDAEEISVAIRQKFAVDAMLAQAAALPPGSLAPTEKALSVTLGGLWTRMPGAAQRMLVTAEYFANHAPADADHSGPLLGLAATCERALFDYVLEEASAQRPELVRSDATFGRMIRWVNSASYPNPHSAEGKFLREYLSAHTTIDLLALRDLASKLTELNTTHRIPAAHREVVSQKLWAEGHSLVLDSTTGALVRLVTVCAPPKADAARG